MLNPKNIPAKTYEELMEENLRKIPVYSREWTNYNPADPGITVLENLTALQIIQQNRIDEMPQAVRCKLLELLGYRRRRGKSAEVYLEAAGAREAFDIPANQRFMVGDISFETALPKRMGPGRIVGVFTRTNDITTDCSYILDRHVTLCAAAFGHDAAEKSSLWIVMDEPPREGEEEIIYVTVAGREGRTHFSDEFDISFAEICWECYTEEGFVPMRVEDGTHGFLMDGYLRLTQPEGCKASRVEEDGISGYVWRARLIHSEYDVLPGLKYMSGFLFPVYQKETMAVTYTFQSASSIVLSGAMLANGYIRVYVKEQKASSYVAYEESTGENDRGRYYRKEKLEHGKYAFIFDREHFGCAPGHLKNVVKIVFYSEEMMRDYCLGEIFGFHEQEINLPREHIVMSTFSVIAQRRLADGEMVYDFLRPGRRGEQEMNYSLYESEGKLVIHNPGKYVGAKLYLGSIAVTLGPEGNVRSGNVFSPVGLTCDSAVCFMNPAPGRGGTFKESLEEMRKRFVEDFGRPETAVTSSDYEALVRRLPGLCIDKVHAWMDHVKNEVQIAVLPGSEEPFPQLSEKYLLEIGKWLDIRRLLSTSIRVRQPVYTAIMVSGTIYVKPHYDGCREQIEAVVQAGIDYVHGSMGFGERLCFDRIFHEIESLDCVSYIYELGINPQNMTYVTMDGVDVIPAPNCLLYPGRIKLDILPQLGSRQ